MCNSRLRCDSAKSVFILARNLEAATLVSRVHLESGRLLDRSVEGLHTRDDVLAPTTPTGIRVAVAHAIVAEQRRQLDRHLLAAACYGSVAHGAAAAHSDLELVLLTDDGTAPWEHRFLRDGVLVECDCLPASRMLSATRCVTPKWGVEADQYRHHFVLWDPDDLFPKVWEAARSLPNEVFENVLRDGWWVAWEILGKARNGLDAGDMPRAVFHAWEVAYHAALRIALYERVPYESARTLWDDVAARVYDLPALLDTLTRGDLASLSGALDAVWLRVGHWGAPA